MDDDLTIDALPIEWQRKIRTLRSDCMNYRIQRNELSAELAALKLASVK